MSESDGAEYNFEKLSKAITEAVMTSPEVKKIVAEIQKNEEICPKSFMVLVLKMEVPVSYTHLTLPTIYSV